MKCPDCSADVLIVDDRRLEPRKSRVGRYLADGTEITTDELRQGVRAHVLHYCPPGSTTPTPEPTQDSLF